MVVIEKSQYAEYDPKTLKKIQNLELMILKEFIRICDENNITYFLEGGTAIGAVRHQGFIPWDDDIDVILLREDYERFLEVMKNYESDTFEFITSDKNYEFCRLYSALKLKGTTVERIHDRKTEHNLGINIEIFPLDNIPNNIIKQKIFKIKRALFAKFLLAFEVTYNDVYISKNKQRIGRIIGKIFNLLNIDQNFVKKRAKSLINYGDEDSEYVCDLNTEYSFVFYPRKIFEKTKKVKFEDIMATLPEDHDTFLSMVYGDYMQIPPKEERQNHNLNVNFGKY